jgi:hypothetical protein
MWPTRTVKSGQLNDDLLGGRWAMTLSSEIEPELGAVFDLERFNAPDSDAGGFIG